MKTEIIAETVLQLEQGNQRFLQKTTSDTPPVVTNPYQLIQKPSPKAVVLTCADSRVPVEIIFDQGIGDLFVIRVAGNIVTPTQIGSIEFGVEHFNIPLVIILGHSHCGAINVAIHQYSSPQPLSPNLSSVVDCIMPLLKKYTDDTPDKDSQNIPLTQHSQAIIEDNVMNSIAILQQSPILGLLIAKGKVDIVGATYSVETGKVNFLKSKE